MPKKNVHTPCDRCPLRKRAYFRPFNADELKFIAGFKAGELQVKQGGTVLLEGSHSAHLYTVFEGWAFRYKIMEDGRRQILNFALPGDLIGLQAALFHEMEHSVEALTPLRLCVFERERFREIYEYHPDLAFDITWIASREERILDEHLLSVGRRSALERAAYLLAFLAQRAVVALPKDSDQPKLPLTQQHVADTLGLSIVHTNKTLRKLTHRKYIGWRSGYCEVFDLNGLLEAAKWDGYASERRPLI